MYIKEGRLRILIDIPEEDLGLLNKLSRANKRSRAELVRQAIANYLGPHKRAGKMEGFGLWAGGRRIDGVVYQDRLRKEWKR